MPVSLSIIFASQAHPLAVIIAGLTFHLFLISQQLLVYHSIGFRLAETGTEIINWPDILKQMAGCQTNKWMVIISVISKGWWVQCQVYVRDGGPAILDYI